MKSLVGAAAGWYHAALLAALPWTAALRPHWAPAVAAVVVAARFLGGGPSRKDPWPWCALGVSTLIFLAGHGGVSVAAGWTTLAAVVAGLQWLSVVRGGRLRHASGIAAVTGWAVAFAAAPSLLATANGGWIAPAVLLVGARRGMASAVAARRSAAGSGLRPPSREIRGTLSLRSVVATGADGLPRTVPMDLELRAGQSLAILCGNAGDAWTLAETLSGRRPPAAGQIAVDGNPLAAGDRLVAVVAPGEPFLAGDLELNIAALCDQFPDRETVVATMEAAGLDEVAESLGDDRLAADGAPLSALHRMQLAAARVIPSDYRIMVVVDPMPWTNPVHGEIWRSTVVRASLGRTAIWISADRELAGRADRVLSLRSGGLREIPGPRSGSEGGGPGSEER